MDFDEYDYLEKAIGPSEPLTDGHGAEYMEKEKGDEDIHKQNDRSRKSRVSEEARDGRRHKHYYHSKKTSVFDHCAERSDRDGHQSERGWQKENARSSLDKAGDRDGRKHDSRERKRRDKDWNVRDGEQERVDGWHTGGGWGWGGRESFYGRSRDISDGRDGEREDGHFDKEVEKEDKTSDGGSRYSREKKKKKEEAASTITEDNSEPDQRTVFASQISLKADERDVYDFFSKAGKVRDVRLIMDQNLRRSKGVGSASSWATSTGQIFRGRKEHGPINCWSYKSK